MHAKLRFPPCLVNIISVVLYVVVQNALRLHRLHCGGDGCATLTHLTLHLRVHGPECRPARERARRHGCVVCVPCLQWLHPSIHRRVRHRVQQQAQLRERQVRICCKRGAP